MYDKPKKILCTDAPDQVVAHQLSDNMVELKRLDQKLIITGNDFSVMATSPKAVNGNPAYTSIICTDGKIDESGLQYKAEKPDDDTPPEGKQFKLDANGEKEKDADGKFIFEDKPAES